MGRLLEVAKAALEQIASVTSPTPVQGWKPEPLPSNFVAIPLSTCLVDPYYTGRLMGKVPQNWSRDGWLLATRDRMRRTDDEVVLGLLQCELDAIEAVTDAGADPNKLRSCYDIFTEDGPT